MCVRAVEICGERGRWTDRATRESQANCGYAQGSESLVRRVLGESTLNVLHSIEQTPAHSLCAHGQARVTVEGDCGGSVEKELSN